jgi:hypothetical protein
MHGRDLLPRKNDPYQLQSKGQKDSLKQRVIALLAAFFFLVGTLIFNEKV